MAESEVKLRLAAVLAADVAGFTRLMADDEGATMAALDAARTVFREHVSTNSGRVVDTAGDSVLAVFENAAGAVQAALAVQEKLDEINENVDETRRMRFRIGIHLGDINEKADGTIFGNGVNVAARLEGVAEPGTVVVSDTVRQTIERNLDIDLANLGEHEVKNVDKPVRAYQVLRGGATQTIRRPRQTHRTALIVAAAVVFVVAGVAVWQTTKPPPAPPMLTAAGTPTDDPILAMPTGPSIAVLPFENLSGGDEHSYFADGLTEELITALSRFQDLKVIARHSTLQFKDQAIDVRDVAGKLGVAYLVEGSVRRSTDTVRITVQLLNGEDGSHLWSETYDRALTPDNLIAVQDDVVSQIVDRVAGAYGEIARRMAAAARNKAPASLIAYDCILRSYAFLEVLTPEEHLHVRDCLEAVIAEDPDNVEALAWLASRYAEEFAFGFNARPEPLERAITTARRAVRLDPSNQWARHLLAYSLFWTGDLAEFRKEADRAIALNPNNALTLADLGVFVAYSGDWDRGLALVKKAIALNPFHPGWYYFPLFFERYYANDYPTALEYAKAINMPGFRQFHEVLAAAYGQLGNVEGGHKEVEAVLSIIPDFTTELSESEWAIWGMTEAQTKLISEGLRKAGLPEAPPEPARPVIAVLPFTNMSGDPEQEYFSDGITEDIITELTRYPDLAVIARNSTFTYKGQAVDVRQVGEDLGARYVLEGSVRRSENAIRVTAQLLDATDGTHLWAETYDRDLTTAGIFQIQDGIAARVTAAIADSYGIITQTALRRIPDKTVENLTSYECVLRAYSQQLGPSEASYKSARACLETATSDDPEYARAWSLLAEVYLDGAVIWGDLPQSAIQDAIGFANRAIKLAPESQYARYTLTYAYFVLGDKDQLLTEGLRAVDLNPNNAGVVGPLGAYIAAAGEWERGIEILNRSIELNPNYPSWTNYALVTYYLLNEDYASALIKANDYVARAPDFYWAYVFSAATLGLMGKVDEAALHLQKVRELNPEMESRMSEELSSWFFEDEPVTVLMEGLRKAGLDIPDEPAAAD